MTIPFARVTLLKKAGIQIHSYTAEPFRFSPPEAVAWQSRVIEWRYTASLPKLNTDRRKLKQVLDNLIGNAIKFTEQGTATVAARAVHGAECGSELSVVSAKPPALEFTVSDTGVGIPGEKLGQIFDKFSQVDSSCTRRFGGVGLGLYIAKKFTDLLGGRLTVARTEGVGSTFTVTIPCEPNAAKR
jgi:signal transduction histidine kinase